MATAAMKKRRFATSSSRDHRVKAAVYHGRRCNTSTIIKEPRPLCSSERSDRIMQENSVSDDARARASTAFKTAGGIINDRLRVWETRKYLQVTNAARYEAQVLESRLETGQSSPTAQSHALTAFLRCLAIDLDAEVAMASLLDHDQQYFLAGVWRRERQHSHEWDESPEWYGCSAIPHKGGLCPQTLSKSGQDLVFEKLDLSRDETTQDLPVVDGRLASFRYYAGTPIITKNRLRIGTVFIFRNAPSAEGLNRGQRSCLTQYAARIMAHLEMSVQALDCTRVAKFNEAVAALTHNRDTSTPDGHPYHRTMDSFPLRSFNWAEANATSSMSGSEIYSHAAHLLLYAFDFGGVSFQNVDLLEASGSTVDTSRRDLHRLLACDVRPGTTQLRPLSTKTLDRLLTCWPAGEVFHRIDESETRSYMAGSGTSPFAEYTALKLEAGLELIQCFPNLEQVIFVPIWDAVHDRVVAIAFCWALDWRRVYSPMNDLFPLTAFCMAVMTLVQRREAQRTEQQKADFLGSVSHEMRSPLHGNLGNLELLLHTSLTEEQRRMSTSALHSGQQLLDTIDKVLAFSMPGQGDSGLGDSRQVESLGNQEHAEVVESITEVNFSQLAEDTVQDIVDRSQTILELSPTPSSDRRNSYISSDSAVAQGERQLPLIVLDIDSPAKFYLGYPRAFRIAITHLLNNAIQHTFEGCIRVSVTMDSSIDGTVTLRVADCGIGLSDTFLQHRIFVPFMQENQLNPGTGLGLALVKRAVDSVQGRIQVESDMEAGTTMSVSLPIKACSSDAASHPRPFGFLVAPKALQIHLCMPSRAPSTPREARFVKLLYESLSCILSKMMGCQLKEWVQGVSSDLQIVLESDLPWLNKTMANAQDIRRLILCGKANGTEHTVTPKNDVRFSYDCILPSALASYMNELLRDGMEGVQTPQHNTPEVQAGADVESSLSSLYLQTTAPEPIPSGSADTLHRANARSTIHGDTPKPRVLLIDDNPINLKVLTMYAQKSAIASFESVSGGQEAVNTFQEAVDPFDILFMDLSMPHVSGFQATSSIRRLEANDATRRGFQRARIIALTGLVSAKDRKAAFDAGVDEYLTKPARMADVKRIIDRWSRDNR